MSSFNCWFAFVLFVVCVCFWLFRCWLFFLVRPVIGWRCSLIIWAWAICLLWMQGLPCRSLDHIQVSPFGVVFGPGCCLFFVLLVWFCFCPPFGDLGRLMMISLTSRHCRLTWRKLIGNGKRSLTSQKLLRSVTGIVTPCGQWLRKINVIPREDIFIRPSARSWDRAASTVLRLFCLLRSSKAYTHMRTDTSGHSLWVPGFFQH